MNLKSNIYIQAVWNTNVFNICDTAICGKKKIMYIYGGTLVNWVQSGQRRSCIYIYIYIYAITPWRAYRQVKKGFFF